MGICSRFQNAPGYAEQPGGAWTHPGGRRIMFVGDLVDRGPKSPEVLRPAMESTRAGSPLAVPGNHDVRFMRKIFGELALESQPVDPRL
jgi:hypothetical protein